MENLTGQSLGRYHTLEPLGEGGMARVYKAFDTRLECEVAVKIISAAKFTPESLERALKRFEREARALARLTHPNIVKVTDYGEYAGQPYLVMPLLTGGNLKQLLRARKCLPWQEAIRLLLPVAEALDYAHSRKIIHRDVKPSNIMLTERGLPLLTDFGVAKIMEDEVTLDLTGSGVGIGTPEYMAPEQVTAKTVDRRADIYALGVVFYELITGRRPFEGDTPLAVLFKHASQPLPRPSQFVPNLPDGIERILIKALAKNPAERYQSMRDFAAALERLAAELAVPVQSSDKETASHSPGKAPSPAAQVRPRQNMLRLIGLALILVIAAGLTAVGLYNLSAPGSAVPQLASLTPAMQQPAQNVATATLQPPATTSATPAPTETNAPTSTPTDLPTLAAGSTKIREIDGMVMVYVPAGEFEMGSNASADEQPIHTVYLDAFWIDKTEITNSMYRLCFESGFCKDTSRISLHDTNMANHPVAGVTWQQAATYCEWAGKRLPTEAEWEKAARGTDGRSFPWGDQASGCYIGCTGSEQPVGSYPGGASPYGALDMAGNLWEWVADWYDKDYYNLSPVQNPSGPDGGSLKVLRGGAWTTYSPAWIRTSYRYKSNPSDSIKDIGVRCAQSQK